VVVAGTGVMKQMPAQVKEEGWWGTLIVSVGTCRGQHSSRTIDREAQIEVQATKLYVRPNCGGNSQSEAISQESTGSGDSVIILANWGMCCRELPLTADSKEEQKTSPSQKHSEMGVQPPPRQL